jgi:hypothetical protein
MRWAEAGAPRPGSAPAFRDRLGAVAAPLCLFLCLACLIDWPWLSGRVTIPWDAKAAFQPQIAFLARSLHQGQSPFWTPFAFSGHPQIADPQAMIF